MTAATLPRTTSAELGYETLPRILAVPMAAGVKILAGTMVALDSNGLLNPVSGGTGQVIIGVALHTYDNTNGAASAYTMEVTRGCFKFLNDTVAPVTQSLMLQSIYALDNQTLTATATGHSIAGKLIQLDTTGVIVQFADV